VATLDAIKDINILSTPADPTNPRDDLIIAQQSDKFYSDASNAFQVKQVVGTPSGTPADPAVTGSPDFVRLARVRVSANATTITNANITDLRTTGGFGTGINLAGLHTVALGGILPVASLAQQNALVGKYDGMAIYRQDLDRLLIWDGAAWRHFGRPQSASVATQENTTNIGYVDLTTPGPAVTVETDTTALVTLSCFVFNATLGGVSSMSKAISGATTLAASDPGALQFHSQIANGQGRLSRTYLQTNLTPGSNTFTCKYKVNSGTGTWGDREIIVEPK